MYYLAYGSNLNLAKMQERAPSATKIKEGYLLNYKLVFWHYLTIVKAEGMMVPIGIFEVSNKADEANLDLYEAYPRLYHKENVEVLLDKKPISGLIYIMNNLRVNEMTSKEYFLECLKGYYDFNLDSSYLYQALVENFKVNNSIKILEYSNLVEEAKDIRIKVFVNEQGFKNEFDDVDKIAKHLVLYLFDAIGTARYYYLKSKDAYLIGRIAILKEYRKLGLGKVIVSKAEENIRLLGGKKVFIIAQERALGFYLNLGYINTNEVVFDEGVKHFYVYKML